jgi:uncharacterized protein (UPF0332 family)
VTGGEPLLRRAHEEVGAAHALRERGYAAQAVSRAYFAAFYAAEAALLTVNETRSKHAGVISAFIRVVVREGGCDERAGRLLRDLFERRGQADYSTDPVPPPEAEKAVADAETVVKLVEDWVAGRT